ncbi:flagellar hook-associated protein FlgK [Phenylobacterium sp.]|uniref:flagellar hook-associated protein FlgK n=1 Tax=Phenylobacterium sp. TaxID=1871053 RepID=UPI001211DBAC|nr:flagellar hook-associated protein FlgK [Phenylobacterium sp.]THD64048.1 MAG: flagellar hook-associated protein FlgK [Phenylobacterium sp.]
MSSLSVSLQTAASGLQAAQASLNAISDNIANVNTPGYVRKVVNQQELVVGGVGAGVDITGVQRVTNQYLQAASLGASADASSASIISQYLSNAQNLFGDPTTSSYFFNMPDQISAAEAALANDPSSSILQGQTVTTINNFLSQANQINTQINQLSGSVDGQVTSDVSQVNSLLSQINSLNTDIARATISGGDATGSQNQQQQLIDQLSGLMNVNVAQNSEGGVTIRSAEGIQLVGTGGASTVNYNVGQSTPGYLTVTTPGASSPAQPINLSSGEIGGLLTLRNTELPGMSDQLGEFVSRTAQAFNAASNAATASPPPNSLTGRNTGLDLPTAISGFTGTSTVAITNSSGVVQQTVAIDFDNDTMSVNGGAATSFTSSTFLSTLNSSLGTAGTASFSNGALSISAASSSNGVAIDEGTSQKAGEGFSQFFGMNDLITSTGLSTYDTGLSSGDPNGFAPGSTITLQLSSANGAPLKQVTVTVPPATSPSMGDLVNALNNSSTGVGLYGAFTLDAQGGLTFTGTAPQNAQVSVVQDDTSRGAGGPSISQLFGIGSAVRSTRASSYEVNPAIAADPTKMPSATLNLSVAAGTSAVAPGDGTGAQAISAATQQTMLFKAAGGLGNVNMTLDNYAAQFGGSIGQAAANAASQSTSATAVQTEANSKLQSVEGVNIDQELVNLTTYQQAYSANARMISATKDLFDVLENLIS